MELPKNVTQIGESDRYCKIYVEDYVISYIKQINQLAENKMIAVALYGRRQEENGISYLFFYGACRLESLQREVRHLSQAQAQETEKLRKKYFPDHQLLGYRLLNGEMVEGFHICEQGICRYISGYACFYEKNDGMLAYMLDTRQNEVKPEEVDQEKYNQIKQRQEERKAQHLEAEKSRTSSRLAEFVGKKHREGTGGSSSREEAAGNSSRRKEAVGSSNRKEAFGSSRRREEAAGSRHEETAGRSREEIAARRRELAASGNRRLTPSLSAARSIKVMRASVVGLFVLLCIVGLTTLNNYDSLDEMRGAARQFLNELTEQKIPDAGGAIEAMNPNGNVDTLVAEDKLAEAIQKENQNHQDGDNNTSTENISSKNTNIENANTENVNTENTSAESSPPEETPETIPAESTEISNTVETESNQEHNNIPNEEPSDQRSQSVEQPVQEASAPVSYTIQKGDTLIGISLRVYGTENRVQDICNLNNIANPDNIQYGQKILLP